jgi:hypothetical protein
LANALAMTERVTGAPLSTWLRKSVCSDGKRGVFCHVILTSYDAPRLAQLLQTAGPDANRRDHQPEQPQEP